MNACCSLYFPSPSSSQWEARSLRAPASRSLLVPRSFVEASVPGRVSPGQRVFGGTRIQRTGGSCCHAVACYLPSAPSFTLFTGRMDAAPDFHSLGRSAAHNRREKAKALESSGIMQRDILGMSAAATQDSNGGRISMVLVTVEAAGPLIILLLRGAWILEQTSGAGFRAKSVSI